MASEANNIVDKLSSIRYASSMALHKIAFNEKEYNSVIELIVDVLSSLGVPEQVIINEVIKFIAGPGIQQKIETAKDNTSKAVFDVVNDWDDDNVSGWLLGLEDAIKVTISNILTGILSCSIDPYLPLYAMDADSKKDGEYTTLRYYGRGILIPISVLDFSGVLDIAPLGMTGQFFYDIDSKSKYYQKVFRTDAKTITYSEYRTEYYYKKLSTEESSAFYKQDVFPAEVIDSIEERNSEITDVTEESPKIYYITSGDTQVLYKKYDKKVEERITHDLSGYTYIEIEEPSSDIANEAVTRTSIPAYIDSEEGRNAPEYIRLNQNTAPATLYRTKDFNAFMWNSLNRGNTDTQVEKNKMMWDSRRLDKRKNGYDTRAKDNGWSDWLKEKMDEDGEFKNRCTDTLYPILQLERFSGYSEDTCIQVSFPSERYNPEDGKRKTIYDFNRDYLKSINIFNPKVIVLNMLMELSKVKIFPEITASLSLKKSILDAKLTEIIVKILSVDDLNVSDCFYSFSNREYSSLLRESDLRQYNAVKYDGNSTNALVYNPEDIVDAANTVANGAVLNEDTTTITRTVFEIATKPGQKEQILLNLGLDLGSIKSNFITDILYAIIMPLIRAIFSPQIMLLFMINFEVMGLIDLSNLQGSAFDKLISAIFRKLVGSLISVAKQIKDAIATILYRLLDDTIKPILDDLLLALILEELDAWLILLRQALNLFRRNKELTMLDDVHYADITTEQTEPENESEKC